MALDIRDGGDDGVFLMTLTCHPLVTGVRAPFPLKWKLCEFPNAAHPRVPGSKDKNRY